MTHYSSEFERAVEIGEKSKAHPGIMARYHHGLSKAFAAAGNKGQADRHAAEAKEWRNEMLEKPEGLDMNDESDAAYELVVKIDQR